MPHYLSDMATNYVFVHKRDNNEYHVTLMGKHLVTKTLWSGDVVQQFESDVAAMKHFQRVALSCQREGYALRHFAHVPTDVSIITRDPLAEHVWWTSPQRL